MDSEKLKSVVNRSGFPLQIRVSNLVGQTSGDHGWRVRYTEHAWKGPTDEGFIDLVLENSHGTGVIVLECKRVLEKPWIFLSPESQLRTRRYYKSWVTYQENNRPKYFDWHEMAGDPATPQSEFCVVDGQDPKGKPMLERTAAEVVAATEALAEEEIGLLGDGYQGLRMYFPVIVTTATLKVCTFDPQLISLQDGMINDANFHEVPVVRFHKQLSTRPFRNDNASFQVRDIDHLAKAKQITVFVVSAEHLPAFLSELTVDNNEISYLAGP